MIVHFNVTVHPSASWTAQQLVEAFPWDAPPRYLLHDRDGVYGTVCQRRAASLGMEEVRAALHSPSQSLLPPSRYRTLPVSVRISRTNTPPWPSATSTE